MNQRLETSDEDADTARQRRHRLRKPADPRIEHPRDATWLKHGVGRPTLCFAVNRAHAQHIADRFEEHGVRAGYVDCDTPANERADNRRKFHSGEYQVVCNVGVLTIGVDWDVRCTILARPTKSEILYTQIVGRGLRTAQGFSRCSVACVLLQQRCNTVAEQIRALTRGLRQL
jgi:superfamily II DNA or RNA helicase